MAKERSNDQVDLFKKLLLDRETNPVILGYALYNVFGLDFFNTPLTVIYQYLLDTFELNELPEETVNKMGAFKVLFSNDLFWSDWSVFEKICKAFNSGIVLFNSIQIPSPEEITYTIKAVQVLRRESFDDEVKGYITAACLEHGTLYPHPDVVKLFLVDKLDEELKNLIKNLEKAFSRIRGRQLPQTGNSVVDGQLFKTMRVLLYLEGKEREFREQKDKFASLLPKTKRIELK